MKTIRCGPLAILILLALASVIFAEAPAPFCAAKQHAMKMPMDSEGDYVWEFTKNDDGQESRYALVYLTRDHMILIARDLFVCAYMEDTGEIKAAVFLGYGFMPVEKPPEEITDFAFKIFRELVASGALGTVI
jgi:hypothetical protein